MRRRAVMISLGHCIRNNAATNIFNKDLDSRNYGVGRYGRVFLFDYDAVEKLTDVKIRTNADREPGEEAVPDWFFEDGVIFLPEELEHGMQLRSDFARRCFREENADLLSVEYWQDVQQKLQRGEVPESEDVSGQRQAQSRVPWHRSVRSAHVRGELAVGARGILVGEDTSSAARFAHQPLEVRRGQGTAEVVALSIHRSRRSSEIRAAPAFPRPRRRL